MIEVNELRALCGDDDSMVKMLLTIYLEEYGESDSVLKNRFSSDDVDGLFQISHELKGMFSNLCAKEAMTLAQVIESSSQAGSLPDQTAINDLCGKIKEINQQIERILQ
ncbi:Hpt domain-containing protein [Shewanella gelidimarina]|uniref:Hpt domain-containing protein n=1 Tax=Shewanella gelidimarina TaxID=56813 RepID=UPI00200EDF11|nr:Hpt domain-containing protein [Shewanella gelidimarina]MCL1059717.1 Hpt domain-containing protein [Shewanella gelidimarina]